MKDGEDVWKIPSPMSNLFRFYTYSEVSHLKRYITNRRENVSGSLPLRTLRTKVPLWFPDWQPGLAASKCSFCRCPDGTFEEGFSPTWEPFIPQNPQEYGRCFMAQEYDFFFFNFQSSCQVCFSPHRCTTLLEEEQINPQHTQNASTYQNHPYTHPRSLPHWRVLGEPVNHQMLARGGVRVKTSIWSLSGWSL